MSDEELIEGYVRGRISRRVFVRRLVAGGLSIGVAMAYGNALAPGPAAATSSHHAHHAHHDHHKHHTPPPETGKPETGKPETGKPETGKQGTGVRAVEAIAPLPIPIQPTFTG